jgi:hypothetical protein
MAAVVTAVEAEVPTAVAPTAAEASMAEVPPTAAITAVVATAIPATAAATEAHAETPIRLRRAVPAPGGRGPTRAEALATPRQDGIPLADQEMPDRKVPDRKMADLKMEDRKVPDLKTEDPIPHNPPAAAVSLHLAVRVPRPPANQPSPTVNSIPSAAPTVLPHL